MKVALNSLDCQEPNSCMSVECTFIKDVDFMMIVRTTISDKTLIEFLRGSADPEIRKTRQVPFMSGYTNPDDPKNYFNVSSDSKFKKHIRIRYNLLELEGAKTK